MSGLQIRVELVQRVPQTVSPQIEARLSERAGDPAAPVGRLNRIFVRVVAEMEHQVQVVFGHVPVGDVVSAGPVLAGRKRKPKLLNAVAFVRRGAEVTNRTLFSASVELIKVVA